MNTDNFSNSITYCRFQTVEDPSETEAVGQWSSGMNEKLGSDSSNPVLLARSDALDALLSSDDEDASARERNEKRKKKRKRAQPLGISDDEDEPEEPEIESEIEDEEEDVERYVEYDSDENEVRSFGYKWRLGGKNVTK